MSSIKDLRDDLADAERWGDIAATHQIREQIAAYEEYRDHCEELRFEAEQEDARLEAYWEELDA